ncbi:porphobilinogen synthase [Pedobacter antarcticus]|uniref:Delta-aminolevulinic acid dehydratase n=2 Tax=Pedobacter antarcticus TaxID=34086 RepID=A0A081PII7_9SPHI|nr:porphobilinogen synthase [Pedobacter antarcticus]KEQ30510.1 delta-aminolevulinic acid dehydratase [Pedobacter antarcticus 4BY]SDM79987.1 porphobilinogen synthase [Pedobacter antarcticus]SFF37294.1 porphobilinogen synthase [Pedobacter antarcticus]
MLHRPRRLRKNPVVREMMAETKLSKDMFVYPYFIVPGKQVVHAIDAMPGVNHFSTDTLIRDVEKGLELGVNKIMLFGVGDEKSEDARSAYHDHSLVPAAVRELKKQFGEDLYVVTDVCVCSYTTHGHCGILKDDYVQNDATVEVIAKMAVAHAQAGADMLAPSDMMDGRIAAIRSSLDNQGLINTAIMSHATKFASAYYGPFREAADCAPSKGDRKAYQMDFRNPQEALREALLDETEGADVLMVKPALAYLDVMQTLKQHSNLPIACYNVSGEYAMVKAAAEKGWIDEQKIVMETMYAFARAGASIITTYHIRDIAEKNWM